MPQHEFELYLKLLGSLLNLAPEQREEIRAELRDHLEERLAELSELGVPREQAIERAIDEFGDAAGLAGSFTQLANQRRRLAMYRTTGTAIAVTLVLLTAAALWPTGNGHDPIGPARVDGAGSAAVGRAAAGDDPFESGGPGAVAADLRRTVEAALERPVEVNMEDVPLTEVVEFLSKSIEVDILIDVAAFDDLGIPLDQPTTLVLRHSKPPARAVIDLLLEQHGVDGEIGLSVRDGFARISTIDADALAVEVYNVRDLIGVPANGLDGLDMGEGGFEGATFDRSQRQHCRFVQLGGAFGGGGDEDMGVMGGEGGRFHHTPPVDGITGLVHVLSTTVSPNSWENLGGPGTIAAFDGLIVIGNSSEVHRRVRSLLDKLRQARQGAPPKGLRLN